MCDKTIIALCVLRSIEGKMLEVDGERLGDGSAILGRLRARSGMVSGQESGKRHMLRSRCGS